MRARPYASIDQLPRVIPIFPLTGVVVLPRTRLPLNIFEPRYLAMVDDAMRGDRVIGMVQPRLERDDSKPLLYETGGLGRITSWSETDDGRLMITLTGVARFRIEEEMLVSTAYRRVRADYEPFVHDLDLTLESPDIDRDRLGALLRAYLAQHKLEANWSAFEEAPVAMLVDSLVMTCPFEPREKQMLLEAISAQKRAETLLTILEFAVHQGAGQGGRLQ